MIMTLDSIKPQIETLAHDWSTGAERNFASDVISAKYNAAEGGFKVVDRALDLAGGYAINKRSELERLFRDSRLGRIHPANTALAHEFVAKLNLGLDPDEMPRWG